MSIVSCFCQENGLVLSLDKLENKQVSEIHCVQHMVRTMPFKNKIFTLDALHCQKATIRAIFDSQNDYLITVKKNQKSLYEKLETRAKISSPLSQQRSEETSHGRKIVRTVSVFDVPEKLQQPWKYSQCFIQVKRSGMRGVKPYEQTAYYLSSRRENAQVFMNKIQGHWRIENQLHWVKDVIFKEDSSRIRQFQPATNLSILKTFAMNLFRFLGFLSVTEGQRWLGERFWRLSVLWE